MNIQRCLTTCSLIMTIGYLMAQPGKVGINTTSPLAPLHVIGPAPTSGPKLGQVMAIFENDAESYIQLSNPENAHTGILSGDRWTAIRSGLIFQGDSSMLLKTGGDSARMIIDNTGRVGINTMNPQAGLEVKDNSVLFTGLYPLPPSAPPPVSGSGVRMMWYPQKGAFRSGIVQSNQWDEDNVGICSFASGLSTIAKGNYSSALGINSKTTGHVSLAMGHYAEAKGDYSNSIGISTMAKSFGSFVVGHYNDTTAISGSVGYQQDPLFIVGNGSTINNRKNAVTVLRNGNTGINTASPHTPFHVVRNGPSGGPLSLTGMVTFESNSQSFIHLSHPNTAQTGILSGNEETSIRSGILFAVDSALLFRTGGNTTRMKLDKAGYLGINTTTPQSRLHVRNGNSSGGSIHPYAIAALESSGNGYLQFSQPNGAEAGILSGNAMSLVRSGIIFVPDSSIIFRSGGNLDRMRLSHQGRLGIGTSTPKAQLHIQDGSSGGNGGYYNPYAGAIIERNDHTVLLLKSPADKYSGIEATDPQDDIRASLVFNADKSVQIKTGYFGVSPQFTIRPDGSIGMGTVWPSAKLDVYGTFSLGVDGTPLNALFKVSVSHDIPAIAGGSSYLAIIPIGEDFVGGTVHISPGSDLPDGIIIAYARTGNEDVRVKFTNINSSAVNPNNMVFHITVIH